MAAGDLSNSDVQDILDRHIESRRWAKANYYGELTEVYRALKMRTQPIYKRDESGRKTKKEDKTQTNICMPAMNIAWRRGVARLTAQPYRLRYTGNAAPEILEMLSAHAVQQYDRSDEAKADRRIVMQAKAFGFSYSVVRRDTLDRVMQFRRALVKNGQLMYRDRASVRRWQGVPEDEINQEMQQIEQDSGGQDDGSQLSDQEVGDFLQRSGYETQVPDMTDEGMSQFIAQNGNVVVVPQNIKKYEGPVVDWVFIGDLDLEPGCLSLNQSDYAIHNLVEDETWLKKQLDTLWYQADENDDELSGLDPKRTRRDGGKLWVQAFDPKACDELLTREPDKDRKIDDLREMFLSVTGKQGQDQYQFPKRLKVRKQFDFLAQHAPDKNGRNWITWVCPNYRDKVIGKMPYQDDLYGKYYFTEMVLFEDLLSCFGDSTVRMMRYLHLLDNRTVAQNYDLVSNQLRKLIMTPENFEMSDEVVVRGMYRQLSVPDPNRVRILEDSGVPPGAFEREAMVQRRMAQVEPNLNTVDVGTASNPLGGKLATTAMLNARASDSLTQFEIDGRDLYIKELGEKKLWINQQFATESEVRPWEIDQKYWGQELKQRLEGEEKPPQWALSDRYGKTVAVRLDPLEIQEDLGVEPISGSYLSVDDDVRRAAANDLAQAAQAAPDILDRRKVAAFYLGTIRNLDGSPEEYILPPPASLPPPPFKGNIGVSVPLDKMPSDVINQILPMMGLQPSEELANRDTLDAVGRMNQAGKEATELTAHAESQMPQPQQQKPQKPKANGKSVVPR